MTLRTRWLRVEGGVTKALPRLDKMALAREEQAHRDLEAKVKWRYWVFIEGGLPVPVSEGYCPMCKVYVFRYWHNPGHEHIYQWPNETTKKGKRIVVTMGDLPVEYEPMTYVEMLERVVQDHPPE